MWEFLIAVIAGIVVVSVYKGLKRDEEKIKAGPDAKKCPDCAEYVKQEARICWRCRHEFGPSEQTKPAPKTQYGPGRTELKVIGVIMLAIAVVVAVAVNFGSSGGNRGNSAAVEACVNRGRAYFSEIGSFPTLSDGRDALTVARERCRRTTTAF